VLTDFEDVKKIEKTEEKKLEKTTLAEKKKKFCTSCSPKNTLEKLKNSRYLSYNFYKNNPSYLIACKLMNFFDEFVEFHKAMGILIFILSFIHTLGQCINLCKLVKFQFLKIFIAKKNSVLLHFREALLIAYFFYTIAKFNLSLAIRRIDNF